jgi:hypothetical protein
LDFGRIKKENCMKKIVFLSFFVMMTAGLWAQNSVDISFYYTRKMGFASNQFAVWIEDAGGNYIKTLYATRFTATGGYKRRAESVPRWVKNSALAKMSTAEADAVSGSTPRAGNLSYRWDGTDKNGKALPRGEYRVCLEATLRNENQVLYTAAVQLGGGRADLEPAAEYSGSKNSDRDMIANVRVSVR